uniref:GT23 domain-containing protein n=1 Tax=Syphacia muris TaxID=451379 RepID=A0A0N5AS11_9BILA
FSFQVSRRQLENLIKELYYYLTYSVWQSFKYTNKLYLLYLLGESAAFADVDNANDWRRTELQKLTEQMQQRIDALQNPDNCSKARKLTCNLNKGCGFGCQIHHVTYCFIIAYGTNRTMLLDNDGKHWSYSKRGWDATFLPISKCSYDKDIPEKSRIPRWSGFNESKDHAVVSLPIIDFLNSRPNFLPLAFPEEFAPDLLKLHSFPPVFFISQFMRYLMRFTEGMKKKIDEAVKFIGPIVGIQIRRTDKVGSEAAFHALDEYVKWAEVWFRIQEKRQKKSLTRRIFIASDDPTVFSEAREHYPEYTVYGDESIAKSAQLGSRYSEQSLIGVIVDIELLSRCSYLVCTFSSQICRMGYELMQIRVGDGGNLFHSLDDVYYYGGQQAHEQVAVEKYKAETEQEIDLEIGDVITLAGNHWNGFSKGVNRRTGKVGLYPSYLVREKWITVQFP